MNIERQELYCHGCGGYVQFNLDLSVDGNYVLFKNNRIISWTGFKYE